MAKSDDNTMAEIVFPQATTYGRGTPSITGSKANLTRTQRLIAEKNIEKSATIESARRLALQARDGLNDVTYSVMDSNQSMIETAETLAAKTKGQIAQKNVVQYNARALGRHQMNLDILQDSAERTMVEVATTDLEVEHVEEEYVRPVYEPRRETVQPARDTRGLVARILNIPQ